MKTYLLNIKDQLHNWSLTLDARSVLCSKSWLVFNEDGQKEVFIFQKDGTLIISVDGHATTAQWKYIAVNGSVLITTADGTSFMMNPVMYDDKVFTLQLDGTQEFAFLIDQREMQRLCLENLERLNLYITNNAEYCRQLQATTEVKDNCLRDARIKWEAEITQMLDVWKNKDESFRELCEKKNRDKKLCYLLAAIAGVSTVFFIVMLSSNMSIYFGWGMMISLISGLLLFVIGSSSSVTIDRQTAEKREELVAAHPFIHPSD